jgi:hypothetical protein
MSLLQTIKEDSYSIINLCFAIIIFLVFVYSGIFSPDKNNYPVVCLHEKITGHPCLSCGLSHSFSLIIQGKIDEANQCNPHGLRVFLFFVAQLIFRLKFMSLSIKHPDIRKQLIVYDSFSSLLVFTISFWPFITALL